MTSTALALSLSVYRLPFTVYAFEFGFSTHDSRIFINKISLAFYANGV
jgi:hypothetical protein